MSLVHKSCVPCKSGDPCLSEREEDELHTEIPSWSLDRTGAHRLMKQFAFQTYLEAIGFAKSVALVAEEEDHLPSMRIDQRTIFVDLYTHGIHGLSVNDFIMAAKIDDIYFVVTQPSIGAFESTAL